MDTDDLSFELMEMVSYTTVFSIQLSLSSFIYFIKINTCTFILIDIVERKEEIREHLNIVVFITYTHSVHGRKHNHKIIMYIC